MRIFALSKYTQDALHCQQDTAREILCAGGDHSMQIKDNQKKIVRNAKAVVKARRAIESNYHARRDGTYCEDVRTRRCGANVTGALLLARTPTFVFFAESETANCLEFKETTVITPRKSTD